MADKQLVQYVQTYHEKGYSIATLRSFLISRGYDPLEVENAIKEAYLPQHHTPKWIIPTLITMGGLLLAGVIFFFIFAFIQEDISLSVSSVATSTPKVNEPLQFRVNVAGASSALPVDISYEVSNGGELVDRNTQSVDASRRVFEYEFTPRSSGEYLVSIVVTNDDTSYRSSFTVIIPDDAKQDPQTTPNNTSSPSDSICGDSICDVGEACAIDCTAPACGDGICSQNEVCAQDCDASSCGNGICDGQETISSCRNDCKPTICGDNICDASETILSCRQDCEAKNSLNGMTRFELTQYIPERVLQVGGSEVAKECKTISAVDLADVCYFEIMKETDQKTYCTLIGSSSKKDDCYITYAFNIDDYSVCSLIVDNYKLSTCESLRRSWEIQAQIT